MTARSGLLSIIETLRGMTDAGTGDYMIGTAVYWDSDHVQTVLDRHRTDVWFEQLYSQGEENTGGTTVWKSFYSEHGNYEASSGGTSVFLIQDSTGALISASDYTADYRRGVVTFVADQAGSARYLTGASYDMDAAAADIWRQKAAHYARSVTFSTDNHRINRSELIDNALQMAKYYESQAPAVVSMMYRSDTIP